MLLGRSAYRLDQPEGIPTVRDTPKSNESQKISLHNAGKVGRSLAELVEHSGKPELKLYAVTHQYVLRNDLEIVVKVQTQHRCIMLSL